MIYYCIKPIEVIYYRLNDNTIISGGKYLINEGDEINILDFKHGITIINSINKLFIYDLDRYLDHFLSQAEWREIQIKSIIDEELNDEIN